MAVIIGLLWSGSLVAGWNIYYPWLVVPPLIFLFHVWSKQRRVLAALKSNGMSGELYKRQMLIPNMLVILWSAALNGVIFGAGALASIVF